jgi:peptide deformylase
MAIRRILTLGDSKLRRKCDAVKLPLGWPLDREPMELINDLTETLIASVGMGLAAPQIGGRKRIIVLKVRNHQPMQGIEDDEPKVIVMINPRIIYKSGFVLSNEGCLSIPGRMFAVSRATEVLAKYQTLEGMKAKIKANGLLAVVIQHELDHLNGTLIIDKGIEMGHV